MTYVTQGQLGDWRFWGWTDHGFDGLPSMLYGFEKVVDTVPGEVKCGEWYNSLEHAMVSAIGEKYTGPRGAGGTGVGTAADWFMKMIGADQLVPADYAETRTALNDIIVDTAKHNGPIFGRAQAIETELNKRGLILARMNTP